MSIEDTDVYGNNVGIAIKRPAYGGQPLTTTVEGHAYIHDNIETESSPPFLDAPWPDGFLLDFLPSTKKNTAPIANAGDDRLVPLGQAIGLHGDGSYDLDGDPLYYTWEQISGPVSVLIPGREQSHVSLNLPVAGNYTFQLSVNDGAEESEPDSVLVCVLLGFGSLELFPAERKEETPASAEFDVSGADVTGSKTGFISYEGVVAAFTEPLSELRQKAGDLEQEIAHLLQTYPQDGGYSNEELEEIYQLQVERLEVLFEIDGEAIELLISPVEFSSVHRSLSLTKKDWWGVNTTISRLKGMAKRGSINFKNFPGNFFFAERLLGQVDHQLARSLRQLIHQIVKGLAIRRAVPLIVEVGPEILFASDALVDLTESATEVVRGILSETGSDQRYQNRPAGEIDKLNIAYVNLSDAIGHVEEHTAKEQLEIAATAARAVAEALGYDLVVSSQDVAVFSPSDQFVDLAGLSDGFTDITDFVKDGFTDYAR